MSKFKPGDLALVVVSTNCPEAVGSVVTILAPSNYWNKREPSHAPWWVIDRLAPCGRYWNAPEKWLMPLNPPPDMLEEERDKELTA